MNTLETIVIFFFLFLAGFVIIGLFRSIMHSSQQGETFYQNLISRIKLLRMHKMMETLGVSPSSYAHGHPVNEIEMHMKRCQECSHTEQCDKELATGEATHAGKYCPNNRELLDSSATQLKQ